MDKLKKYNAKRNFKKTAEPKGKLGKSSKKLKYVIQHHYARKEHYDLRLEYQGVYVSFAVPKGPSFNPKDKRLAVKVEDHPLSYGNFEGNIPKGEYGAGAVMLWDKGYWEPLKGEKVNFNKGPIKFILRGERLNGAWSLVKFKEQNFLLIKEKDETASNKSISKYKTSIKTGRTINEIRNDEVTIKDVAITSPEKIIYPKDKITKEEIYNYYKLIGNKMMPFLEDRLISIVRSPSGLKKDKFYMKHLDSKSPDIGKKKIKGKNGDVSDYYYFKNINGLLSEVQMNSYEFHIWGSKQNRIKHPDLLIFDLDPDEGLSLAKVREGVKDLKSILDDLKLKAYLKTSGGKGYHIVIPIKMPSYRKLEEIASKIADLMVQKWPQKYTTNIRKEQRKGKIFIDYFRNKEGATSVCPYSLRLKDGATVSMPIAWNSLDKVGPQDVTIKNIKDFLKKKDPWTDFFQ